MKVNDKAKRHNGLLKIIVDKQEMPLKFTRGLLHVPIREPTDEELQLLPIFTSLQMLPGITGPLMMKIVPINSGGNQCAIVMSPCWGE